MIYDLHEVFKNGPDDIQERMDVIANTIDGIMRIQKQLQESGYWCSHCQRWYYQDDCSLHNETKTRLVCTNPFQGYLDPYEYEERTETEWYDICPKGHKISEQPRFYI